MALPEKYRAMADQTNGTATRPQRYREKEDEERWGSIIIGGVKVGFTKR